MPYKKKEVNNEKKFLFINRKKKNPTTTTESQWQNYDTHNRSTKAPTKEEIESIC